MYSTWNDNYRNMSMIARPIWLATVMQAHNCTASFRPSNYMIFIGLIKYNIVYSKMWNTDKTLNLKRYQCFALRKCWKFIIVSIFREYIHVLIWDWDMRDNKIHICCCCCVQALSNIHVESNFNCFPSNVINCIYIYYIYMHYVNIGMSIPVTDPSATGLGCFVFNRDSSKYYI